MDNEQRVIVASCPIRRWLIISPQIKAGVCSLIFLRKTICGWNDSRHTHNWTEWLYFQQSTCFCNSHSSTVYGERSQSSAKRSKVKQQQNKGGGALGTGDGEQVCRRERGHTHINNRRTEEHGETDQTPTTLHRYCHVTQHSIRRNLVQTVTTETTSRLQTNVVPL